MNKNKIVKKGFKIICNNCGNIVEVKNDTGNKDYIKNKFSFYPVQDELTEICCDKCGNEVYIHED